MAKEQAESGPHPKILAEDTVLQHMTGYQLKRAYINVQPVTQNALAEVDLRVISFSCLSMIVDNPGIVQFELAQALQMERSNLVVVVDELERRDLITRERVMTDRRRYALTATLLGRRLRDRAAKKAGDAEQKLLSALSQEEQQTLRVLLGRIGRHDE